MCETTNHVQTTGPGQAEAAGAGRTRRDELAGDAADWWDAGSGGDERWSGFGGGGGTSRGGRA